MGKTRKKEKPPVHPGIILREGYMKERKIIINEMGEALSISRNQMSSIVNGRKGITTKTAVKLAEVTVMTPNLLNADLRANCLGRKFYTASTGPVPNGGRSFFPAGLFHRIPRPSSGSKRLRPFSGCCCPGRPSWPPWRRCRTRYAG